MKEILIKYNNIKGFYNYTTILSLGVKEDEKDWLDYEEHIEYDCNKPISIYLAEFINRYNIYYDIKGLIKYNDHTESYECECCGNYYDNIWVLEYNDKSLNIIEDGHFGNHVNWNLDDKVREFFRYVGFDIVELVED